MSRESVPASRILVILPTYNEAENVEDLSGRVLGEDPRIEVLVVDDGRPSAVSAGALVANDIAGFFFLRGGSGPSCICPTVRCCS